MDAFSCYLDSSPFLGIPLGSSSLKHLLYADDVLVFGMASISNAIELSKILDNFALPSGLHINNNKCSILFSKILTVANDIIDILGFSAAKHTFKYLGLPISTKKLNSSHFQPLLSRISTLVGKIRGAIIPKFCCKSIDRMCSRFLFHGPKEGKKLHLIAWHDTCLPTCFGGLGIPNLPSLSHGFASSFIWRFYNSSSLVFDWYRHRFTSPFKPAPHKCSKYWRYICGVANKLKGHLNITVNVENCRTISFYWDPWLKGISLADIVPYSSDLLGPISVFWNLNWAVPDFLPLEVKHRFLLVGFAGVLAVLVLGLASPFLVGRWLDGYYLCCSWIHGCFVIGFCDRTMMTGAALVPLPLDSLWGSFNLWNFVWPGSFACTPLHSGAVLHWQPGRIFRRSL
ncbi:hypothetical protein KFK09_019289 [Dendrobium nobile]|uniref:Reverse transcriptase domain-containing protein n=1 Tax=Dendrobium nobile TaxID=94219 RepID=A0A8T3AYB6_DENNO|nr:hypothetical protein KFK09_019289 [Dendrobium nobile]